MFFLTAPHIIARVGESLDVFQPEAELVRLTEAARQAAVPAARAAPKLRRVA